MKRSTSIEPLEPRIAPASITIVGKMATWTDHDGDIVTMKWSSASAPQFTKTDRGLGLSVSRILLDPVQHDGASFTVTVKAASAFGDGRVELGHLDGPGVALKSWVGAKAGISEIDFGDNTTGIGKLIIGGYGQTKSSFFTGSMGDGHGAIKGNTTFVKIIGDIANGRLEIGAPAAKNKHGSITVTGSLRGDITNAASVEGQLLVAGDGRSLSIGGSVLNGRIDQSGNFKSVTIGGDVIGRDDFPTDNGIAEVRTEKLTILGSVLGGRVKVSDASSPLKSIFIGGSLIARDDLQESGTLNVVGSPKTITVKGNLVGGQFSDWLNGSENSVDATAAGAIAVEGDVGTINIGGSIHAGTIATKGSAVNGGISVTGNVGSLNVGKNILGYDVDPALIIVEGSEFGLTGNYNAIGKINIKGDATHAYIAAGYYVNPAPLPNLPQEIRAGNPDAGIGQVKIGGNFVNSNIFAGVYDGGSPGVNSTAIGDGLEVGDSARTAKLGPVVIKGHLLSDRDALSYSGFAADTIASIVVNGRQVFKAGDGLRNFDTFITAREL